MRKVLPVRIPVYIDAEIICGQKNFAGMIGNVSLDGAFVETIPTKTVTPFLPGKTIDLRFSISTKNSITLSCKVVWLYTKKDESGGFVNSMGLKIFASTGSYEKYMKSL